MTADVTHVVVGPRRHGVVRFGLALQNALEAQAWAVDLLWAPEVAALPRRFGTESATVHLQFTDRLFGPTADAAAAVFTALSSAVQSTGAEVTVTLHDIPQPSDGPHFDARASAYRRVLAGCDTAVVSSIHERELLHENNISGCDVRVIPLPIDTVDPRPPVAAARPATVGVFGFVYPGKGHENVIAAAEGLPSEVEISAIGAASEGHEDLIVDLREAAARQHRVFHISGHVPERELVDTLRAVAVPVIAHRHVSASGSMNSWLSAGRRPLAPQTRYTCEVARRNPGCLQLFPHTTADMGAAIRHALDHPASTWLAADTELRPSKPEVAAAYADVFHRVPR